jgi:hypothetical protein
MFRILNRVRVREKLEEETMAFVQPVMDHWGGVQGNVLKCLHQKTIQARPHWEPPLGKKQAGEGDDKAVEFIKLIIRIGFK